MYYSKLKVTNHDVITSNLTSKRESMRRKAVWHVAWHIAGHVSRGVVGVEMLVSWSSPRRHLGVHWHAVEIVANT